MKDTEKIAPPDINTIERILDARLAPAVMVVLSKMNETEWN